MAVNKAYLKYRENSINTSSPEELTLMLYNGLVRFLMQSKKAIDENNIPKAHESIVRSQDIIMEFEAGLDLKYDIAHNLLLLYDYMHRRLIEANVHKDRAIVEEVLQMAVELRDTWEQAMKIAKESQLSQTISK